MGWGGGRSSYSSKERGEATACGPCRHGRTGFDDATGGNAVAAKSKKGLTDLEKRIVKALIVKGWRNQDIHAWINIGRQTTVNFGRISGVKKNANQQPATGEELEY